MSQDEQQIAAVPPIAGNEPRVVDALFQMVVSLVEFAPVDVPMPVTVLSGGHMICGHLVRRRAFVEAIASTIITGIPHATATEADTELRKTLAELNEGADAKVNAMPEGDLKRTLVSYFHLKGARFRSGGSHPFPSNGTWWRGRVSQVDGFQIGHIF